MHLRRMGALAIAAAVSLPRTVQPQTNVDLTPLRAALARIEVKKTYTGAGVQSGPNYGTGIVIAADCATVFVVTAAHLLRPEAQEADFDPRASAFFYVDRATDHPATVVRDFSRDRPPHDLVVLEIPAADVRKDIPRLAVRPRQAALAPRERLFALAQFGNNVTPFVATAAVPQSPTASDAVLYDAGAIEKGFSGGPVFDSLGRLAGVHLDLVDGKAHGSAVAGYALLDLLNMASMRASNLEATGTDPRGQRYEIIAPTSLGSGFTLQDMLEFSAARQSYGPLPFPRATDVRIDWNAIHPDQKVLADLQTAVEPTTAVGRAGILNVARNIIVQSTAPVPGMRDITRPAEFHLEIPPDCGVQTYRLVGERLHRPGDGPGNMYGDVWATGSMGVAEAAVSLGGSLSELVQFVRADAWMPIPGAAEVAVDWNAAQLTGVTAHVTVVLHAYSKGAVPAISTRLRELTTGRVVAQRDGLTNHTDRDITVRFTLSGPRDAGVKRYRLEASLTDSDEHASVVGYLVLQRD